MSKNKKVKGTKIIVDSLKDEKVEYIFGIPGGSIIPLYDEYYDSDIKHILMRHEQAAAHAADGYARATGKTGVCTTTSGPGATNLVTGIATAYMDSVPLVALTGQVETISIGNDAFQEADITGITLSITKHNYLVKDVDELQRIIKEAFYIASTGRPGPVLIDLPKDVQTGETEYDPNITVNLRGYKPTYKGHPVQIKKAADMILNAERAIIIAGGGVTISGANKELINLSELLNIPVATTIMGKGTFPEDHPLSLGILGMHGTTYANYSVSDSDLILAIGTRFSDRVTGDASRFAPDAKIIHIDIDPAEIGKNVRVDLPIVGDSKNILNSLLSILKTKISNENKGRYKKWIEKVSTWKMEHPLHFNEKTDTLKPQYVIKRLYEITKGNAIIVTEVGQHQMWTAQYYLCKNPRQFISSGGLGTMGYGFPASIGVKIALPNSLVFDVAGDGSFQMNCQELATAVQNNIDVKVAIINNGYLGMVRQWQELFYNRRYSNTRLGYLPDFVKFAESYNAKGIRVTKKSEVDDAIQEAIRYDGPVLIDFRVEEEENVFPMVPAGKTLTNIIEVDKR
ncbi:MAG: biosynthetic-type acetolactate synthase large subunit [Candidatus Methanoliparum thermophilum]|uniref:Acetolactate synthase n=1 Tax=Methanoliparum thermophilum TaxID=2491083 RepID=A0A520KQK5_METT2|nr:biosynthetic-type acetolactate synthase large subunit [Candidatus Methanoliparum sp. LAM-1]RZN63808.1 MAG: biosynthetic-type acetolactate synthase large subunit [Candidatus Methanoliparum thermophilum]BDC36468.1 acetolactate synthase [Candidatus Methanoliparum sp. LAM-1]